MCYVHMRPYTASDLFQSGFCVDLPLPSLPANRPHLEGLDHQPEALGGTTLVLGCRPMRKGVCEANREGTQGTPHNLISEWFPAKLNRGCSKPNFAFAQGSPRERPMTQSPHIWLSQVEPLVSPRHRPKRKTKVGREPAAGRRQRH